ncbi:hypothetical protein [Sphingobium subterraneum]|uniref:MFS transporter n=1 Tax=Sphingobium subterraneum TaxID=627688 RepID=A0A841J3F8_9SPHN|nr:hypothetical protein [Sphingobium subterraneum]MBB6125220.1 hypothetical protein [Sphingobium subterraneum]
MEAQSFRATEIASVLVIAIVVGIIAPLQPLLLGSLLSEGRINGATMGLAATVEGLGIVLATAIGGAWQSPERLRGIAAIAIASGLAANVMTILLPASGIVVARGIAGVSNGVLLWLFLCLLARSELPTRIFGYFVAGNSTLTFLISLVLGKFAIARFGADAGYFILVGFYILLLAAVRFLPRAYVRIAGGTGTAMPPPLGVAGLVGICLSMMGVFAFWIYSIPLGQQSGIPINTMQFVVGIATGAQILAGVAAITLAARLNATRVVLFTTAMELIAVGVTLTGDSASLWIPALLAFAFCWFFSLPFHIAFSIDADPTRRAAVFAGTAQLLGVALGPLLASLVISPADYSPARLASICCFAAVLLIAAVVWMRKVQKAPNGG